MRTDAQLYRYHVENLRSVEHALKKLDQLTRNAISQNQEKLADALLKNQLLLVGAWIECRLKKLLFENGGFTAQKRAYIIGIQTQPERWKAAIKEGFKDRYQVSRLNQHSLDHSSFSRYNTIASLLNDDITPLIKIRNKLAHGQFSYQFNSEGNDISTDIYREIQTQNLLSTKFKRQMTTHIANLVHGLLISTAFERDFDKHFRLLTNAKTNLSNRSYDEYKNSLITKYQRGLSKRSS